MPTMGHSTAVTPSAAPATRRVRPSSSPAELAAAEAPAPRPVRLGKDAAGLSPTNIARLTAAWDEEYQAFRRRDLSACDYVYVWVDGIHFNIRLEEDRLCTLVMIGVFVAEFEAKYPKATACLVEDQGALLAFFALALDRFL